MPFVNRRSLGTSATSPSSRKELLTVFRGTFDTYADSRLDKSYPDLSVMGSVTDRDPQKYDLSFITRQNTIKYRKKKQFEQL